ncbi:hypothetical protein LX36DRAFT_223320 [Colletotrichum falcatum]|nr:hypothetical protein LX36DRAFT_223320 [Colletotrichum falcatum]
MPSPLDLAFSMLTHPRLCHHHHQLAFSFVPHSSCEAKKPESCVCAWLPPNPTLFVFPERRVVGSRRAHPLWGSLLHPSSPPPSLFLLLPCFSWEGGWARPGGKRGGVGCSSLLCDGERVGQTRLPKAYRRAGLAGWLGETERRRRCSLDEREGWWRLTGSDWTGGGQRHRRLAMRAIASQQSVSVRLGGTEQRGGGDGGGGGVLAAERGGIRDAVTDAPVASSLQ